MLKIPRDLTYAMDFVVTPEHTIAYLDDRLPSILSTSTLVIWMETVATFAVQSYLCDGYITVGVNINLEHLTFTLVGQTIHVNATVSNLDGNFINFHLLAVSEGVIVGKADHHRAIISQKVIHRKILKKRGNKYASTGSSLPYIYNQR
jgi:fluoroacetyl-CoA thioesterase